VPTDAAAARVFYLREAGHNRNGGAIVKRIDVVKKGDKWVGQSKGQTVRNTGAARKTEAVKNTARVARNSSEKVTVKIHKENGRFQEERTYPRSADPKRSKG
jgi:Uncharacterized protein conserved in bacteria (DUF2188)